MIDYRTMEEEETISPQRQLAEGLAMVTDALERHITEHRDVLEEMRNLTGEKNRLLTVSEVAKQLGVGTAWVYTRIERKSNPLPHFKDGVIRIRQSELDAWINAQVKRPTLTIQHFDNPRDARLCGKN